MGCHGCHVLFWKALTCEKVWYIQSQIYMYMKRIQSKALCILESSSDLNIYTSSLCSTNEQLLNNCVRESGVLCGEGGIQVHWLCTEKSHPSLHRKCGIRQQPFKASSSVYGFWSSYNEKVGNTPPPEILYPLFMPHIDGNAVQLSV